MQARIEIVWERESGEASYNLVGLTHVEAQRVLMAIVQANMESALAEVQGLHEHPEMDMSVRRADSTMKETDNGY